MSDICAEVILLFGIRTAVGAKRSDPWEISTAWSLACRKRATSKSHIMPDSEVSNVVGNLRWSRKQTFLQ